MSPFWIDSIFFNALASWISSLDIFFVASSRTLTLILSEALSNVSSVLRSPEICNALPNALCKLTVLSFPIKSRPACANACKSPTFTALSSPVVWVSNAVITSFAFSGVIGLSVSRVIPANPFARLFNVVAFVVVPSALTSLNSGFAIPWFSNPVLGVPLSLSCSFR